MAASKLWWSAAASDRFCELLADGQFAGLIVHEDAGGRYVFTHAFIAEGYRGRGLSGVLMSGVLGTSSGGTSP